MTGKTVTGGNGSRGLTDRGWIASVLRADAHIDLMDRNPQSVMESATSEGILPMLDWQLRQHPHFGDLPLQFRDALADAARQYAVHALFANNELARLGAVFSQLGIRVLLLKGHALARWLYPQPYLRVCGDVDLLFASREEADHAANALVPLDYQLAFNPGRMNYEMTSRLFVGGRLRLELDLHSRLVNMPAFAEKLQFEELWLASLPLPGLAGPMRGLAPVHAMVHACLNRSVDLMLANPDELKRLLDIHLMANRFTPEQWSEMTALLTARGLCGVCLRSFRDVIDLFHSVIPANVLLTLEGNARMESLDYLRLDDWRYMQGQSLKALPTFAARARWLSERLLPTKSHLHELHGEGGWARLIVRRLWRGLRRLSSRA